MVQRSVNTSGTTVISLHFVCELRKRISNMGWDIVQGQRLAARQTMRKHLGYLLYSVVMASKSHFITVQYCKSYYYCLCKICRAGRWFRETTVVGSACAIGGTY